MHAPRPLPLALALVLVLGFGAPGLAAAQEATPADAPPTEAPTGWPMYRGDPARTGSAAGAGPVDAPAVRWRVETGGGPSSPAVAGGTVYAVGAANYLFALDAATGAERWRFEKAATFSSPAVAGGLVAVGSTDGVHAL